MLPVRELISFPPLLAAHTPASAGPIALRIVQNGRANNSSQVAALRQEIINDAERQALWRTGSTNDSDANLEGSGEDPPVELAVVI